MTEEYRYPKIFENQWFTAGFINMSLSINRITINKLLHRNTGLTICLLTFLSSFNFFLFFLPFLFLLPLFSSLPYFLFIFSSFFPFLSSFLSFCFLFFLSSFLPSFFFFIWDRTGNDKNLAFSCTHAMVNSDSLFSPLMWWCAQMSGNIYESRGHFFDRKTGYQASKWLFFLKAAMIRAYIRNQ